MINQNKMTAVEFIVEQLAKNGVLHSSDIAKAKEMEKYQIVQAYLKGYLEEIPNPSASHYYKDMAEQYYNQTFKSE